MNTAELSQENRTMIAEVLRDWADATQFGNSALSDPEKRFSYDDVAGFLRARADRIELGQPDEPGLPKPLAMVDRCAICSEVFRGESEPRFLWTLPASWAHKGCA